MTDNAANNPFSVFPPPRLQAPSLAAARGAAALAAASRTPLGGTASPPVDNAAVNPFARPAAAAPTNASAAAPAFTPAPAPVVKPLSAFVSEYFVTPGSAFAVAARGGGGSGGIPAPLPLRLVQYLAAPPPPPPPIAAAATAAVDAPPTSPPLPLIADAIVAARTQQWQRLLASIPPAEELLRNGAAASTPLAQSVVLARCRFAALAGSRKWLAAVQDAAAVLGALAGTASTSESAGADGVNGSIALWLCLYAEGLRSVSMWHEAVFIAHGVVRALWPPTPPPAPGAPATTAPVRPVPSPANGCGGGGASWLAPLYGPLKVDGGDSHLPPLLQGPLHALDALAACGSGNTCAAVPRRTAAFLIPIAAGIASAALADAGFAVAAANCASDAVTAVEALIKADAAAGDATATTSAAAAAATTEGDVDGGLAWALRPPPSWVGIGLSRLAAAKAHRHIRREVEASAFINALLGTSQWRSAWDLVAAAVAGTVGAPELAAVSPTASYAMGVLGCHGGGEALAAGRCADALPLYEVALVALASRFLPPPPPPAAAAAAAAATEAGGGVGAAAAAAGSAVAASAATASAALFADACSAGGSLYAASVCVPSGCGGASLLPNRGGGGVPPLGGAPGGVTPLATPPVPSWAPDPTDLLLDAAVGVAECVRRLPPAPLPTGGAPTGPPIPPIAVSIALLEALTRTHPGVALRPALTLALCTLYDAGRDPMSATRDKKVLAAVGACYGLVHLEAASFRLQQPSAPTQQT